MLGNTRGVTRRTRRYKDRIELEFKVTSYSVDIRQIAAENQLATIRKFVADWELKRKVSSQEVTEPSFFSKVNFVEKRSCDQQQSNQDHEIQ